MYENDFMYAVERSPEYLAHYGIRGMKWGVRKAIASGNSARLGRQYAKAQKKLAKLEKRAGKTKKYARRAALMGVGAAAAGGLAAAGTTGVGRVLRKSAKVVTPGAKALGSGLSAGGKALGNLANAIPGKQLGMAKLAGRMGAAGNRISKNAVNAGQAMRRAGFGVTKWGTQNTLGNAAANAIGKTSMKGSLAATKALGVGNSVSKAGFSVTQNANKLRGVTNNTIARIGAGVVGAGLAAGAAKNAYRAATAKKKAEKFRSEMNKAFAGTKYANGGQPRQGKKRRRR